MSYSAKEVTQYIEEEDVKFIRLAFCDTRGKMKNLSIMPGELRRAFDSGIAFDASAIPGFGGEIKSDLFLFPDPGTITVLPWRPEHGRVVRMYCDIMRPDGTNFECDTRHILKNAVKKASDAGYTFNFGSELEFYLFQTDDSGNPTDIPHDTAGYMDIAPDDKGENVRREICLTLEQMGIYPECSHHEEGPGQNEIDFRYAEPLTSADNAVTFLNVVRTVAKRNGLYADFSPKPISDKPGNGFHINISAKKRGGDDMLLPSIAGILSHIADMTAFLDPSPDSYNRLGRCKAPKYISWSEQNRSQLIRIPAADGEYRRAELRSPDPTANPYLAYALLIHAAIDGIENGLVPPQPYDQGFGAKPDGLGVLPTSLNEAARLAAASSFIESCLPQSIISDYCAAGEIQ